jgi:hypothetical protein
VRFEKNRNTATPLRKKATRTGGHPCGVALPGRGDGDRRFHSNLAQEGCSKKNGRPYIRGGPRFWITATERKALISCIETDLATHVRASGAGALDVVGRIVVVGRLPQAAIDEIGQVVKADGGSPQRREVVSPQSQVLQGSWIRRRRTLRLAPAWPDPEEASGAAVRPKNFHVKTRKKFQEDRRIVFLVKAGGRAKSNDRLKPPDHVSRCRRPERE